MSLPSLVIGFVTDYVPLIIVAGLPAYLTYKYYTRNLTTIGVVAWVAIIAGYVFGSMFGHSIIPLGVFALTLLIGVAVIFFKVRKSLTGGM